jgi:hypothetical protein
VVEDILTPCLERGLDKDDRVVHEAYELELAKYRRLMAEYGAKKKGATVKSGRVDLRNRCARRAAGGAMQ